MLARWQDVIVVYMGCQGRESSNADADGRLFGAQVNSAVWCGLLAAPGLEGGVCHCDRGIAGLQLQPVGVVVVVLAVSPG